MKKKTAKLANTVWLRLRGALQRTPGAPAKTPPRHAASAGASRQPSLESEAPAYVLINDSAIADVYFRRLQQSVYRQMNMQRAQLAEAASHGPRYYWESGRINPGRLYFYLKPLNEAGWLFERSGLGWVVSRCEKIVGQDLFLRQHEPWDLAALYEPAVRRGYCRVASEQTGGDLISFAVYEQMITSVIWSALDDAEAAPAASRASLPKLDVPF